MTNLLKIITISLLYLTLMVATGFLARDLFLDKTKPFPTWTYKSEAKILNIFTSWDSGFFYDLATNMYPSSKSKVAKTEINLPEKSFVKLFLGSAQIGNKKELLPAGESGQKVTNLLVSQNDRTLASSLIIYQAYPGMTYCLYSGKPNFDRDLKSFKEALSNPQSCGDRACDKAYFSYFDIDSDSILQQGFFDSQNPEQPKYNKNTLKPDSGIYEEARNLTELGCRSVKEEAITYESANDYKQKFSTFAFMPLYPLLVKTFSLGIFDKVLVGILLSYGFFVISIFLVYKLCFEITKNPAQSSLASLLFLAVPGSFYLLTFQDTSLFTMLSILTLYFYYKEKTWAGIISVFFLTLTNLYGVLILIPLFFIKSKKPFAFFGNLVAIGLALVSQTYYLYTKTEDLLVLLNSKLPWYAPATTFIGGLTNYLYNIDNLKLLEFLLPIIFIIFMIIVSLKLNKFGSLKEIKISSFVLLFLGLVILNGGFTGIIKYLPVTLLPLILSLPENPKNKTLIYFLLGIFIILNLVMFALWTISSRLIV